MTSEQDRTESSQEGSAEGWPMIMRVLSGMASLLGVIVCLAIAVTTSFGGDAYTWINSGVWVTAAGTCWISFVLTTGGHR